MRLNKTLDFLFSKELINLVASPVCVVGKLLKGE